MKWKTIIALLLIFAALIPAHIVNQWLQKKIRPRESIGRLFLYLFSGMLTIFVFVMVLVFLIKVVFPGA